MVCRIGRFSLCLMLCVVASCGSLGPSRAGGSSSDQLRQLIKERRYHEAYALVDVVMEELKDLDEGGAGCEYVMLLSATVGTGQHEWRKILADPGIDLHHKITLVQEIHEGAVRGTLDHTAP